MKVILNQYIPSLGNKFDVVEVSNGYAMNYLVPRNLATVATAAALSELEKKKKLHALKAEADKEKLAELSKKLHGLVVEIKKEAGEGGKLFGSATTSDIAEAILKSSGVEVDKKKIELNEPIKSLGEHTVKIKFLHDIEAKVTVRVNPS